MDDLFVIVFAVVIGLVLQFYVVKYGVFHGLAKYYEYKEKQDAEKNKL